MELLSSTKVSGGWLKRYRHESLSVKGDMVFAIFLPAQAESANVPVLYWLSGLTCTDENFSQKAGAFKKAAEQGLAIVMPDTSPRGTDYPAEHESYDFGSGAGFYVNATVAPYSNTYHMYDYVVKELPTLVEEHFPVTDKRSISGHSMGGHGALICALKNPGRYQSVSAFAPITNPTQCPWGEKAFTGYLGDDREAWKAWDACELIATASERLPLLVDQGEADGFLEEQLKPEALEQACEKVGHPLTLRRQSGYDHSYFFISSFIDDHLEHHAQALKA
ncbi:S-formylglutathione hydrolase [Marinomonas piezotolerans]|uniref:S-formylglutathione hydrolase n=1 Tax=Marinomonas piezotolerans TaxID=2213058 RepID=A0A370U9Y1_9GAMM|nr:S-formylglutathione hydrolase [Marinomonas piezotolerans]RDL44575.1 S-formylglutathione hydrolase [Marinomonas piezotolerans]